MQEEHYQAILIYGVQIQVDSLNQNIVYTGFQFGNYYRLDKKTKQLEPITPKSAKDEKPLRFNWQTPVLLSSHNQDIVYFGSNFLHRSMNQGKDWEKISEDVTKGFKEGNVAYGTITTRLPDYGYATHNACCHSEQPSDGF